MPMPFLNLSSILGIQSVDYRPVINENESQLTYLMCHYKLIVTIEQKQAYIAQPQECDQINGNLLHMMIINKTVN